MTFLESLLTQLVSTSVVIAAGGFILRAWVTHQLEKQRERHAHDLNVKLEEMRAAVAVEVARLAVREPHLHAKRTAVIEAVQAEMLKAEYALQRALMCWWLTATKPGQAALSKMPAAARGEIPETLATRTQEFLTAATEIKAMLHKNSLYFTEDFAIAVWAEFEPYVSNFASIDPSDPPPLPTEWRSIIEAGQKPRSAVNVLLRELLGVDGERAARSIESKDRY